MSAIDSNSKAIIQDFLACDEDFYEYCCVQAKVAEECPFGLTEHERVAIWVYSSTDSAWYERINRELRGPAAANQMVEEFAALLNRAIAKLPQFDGLVYRGMTLDKLDDYVPYYVKDAVVRWDAFTSSSRQREKAFRGNSLFIIQSHNGRCLDSYADKPDENEVLFAARTYFRVIASERIDDRFIVFVEEMGP